MSDRTPMHRRTGIGPDGVPPSGQPSAGPAAPDPARSGAPAHDPAAAQMGVEAAAAMAAAQAAAEAEIQGLAAELEAASSQAADLLGALQRERAEFQNFRRRTTDEREREAGLAADHLLKKVLSIADDFDRAIEARPADLADHGWSEGIGAIDRKLRGLLESEGVRPIEAVGKPFDPREHEAITSVPGTGRPDGEVIAEVQRGYRVRDRILRPALVAVAVGGGAHAAPHAAPHAPPHAPTGTTTSDSTTHHPTDRIN